MQRINFARNYEKNNTWNIRRLVNKTIVPWFHQCSRIQNTQNLPKNYWYYINIDWFYLHMRKKISQNCLLFNGYRFQVPRPRWFWIWKAYPPTTLHIGSILFQNFFPDDRANLYWQTPHHLCIAARKKGKWMYKVH